MCPKIRAGLSIKQIRQLPRAPDERGHHRGQIIKVVNIIKDFSKPIIDIIDQFMTYMRPIFDLFRYPACIFFSSDWLILIYIFGSLSQF